VYEILPGYSIEKYAQYPDASTLKMNHLEALQPMRLGCHYFAVFAQFGNLTSLKTGFDKDK